MSREPPPESDELRARHYLRRLGARPLGHQEPPMPSKKPIQPTAIIPAGAPLPPGSPAPGAVPPWRTPPPPPPPAPPASPPAPPPPPPPSVVVVRHTHEVLVITPDPDPDPGPPWWARLWDWLVTWRNLVAIVLALLPWAGGRSPVGIWAHTLHQARTEASIPAAYIIATVALTAAWALDKRTGRAVPRFLLVTALAGSVGALGWFDAITLITGVHT